MLRDRLTTLRTRASAARFGVSALSPAVLFPAIWFLGVALAQIHVLRVQRPWSQTMWLVVFITPVAFVLGAWAGRTLTRTVTLRLVRSDISASAKGRRRLRWLLVAFVVIGYLEQAHQFAAVGAIPLLSSNVDATRAAQPGGPTIVLTDLLTVAAIVALTVPPRLVSREAIPELFIGAVALLGFALAGGRVTIVLPLVAAFFARALYRRPPRFRTLAAAAAVLAIAASSLFFYRSSQHPANAFEQELYDQVLPSTPVVLQPLIPLHIGIATNYEALARVVDYFPQQQEYGHGRYSALGLDLFIHDARNLGDVTTRLSGPWVTSTTVGPFWADGGFPLVMAGLALIGALSAAAYVLARRTRSLRHCLVAGYFLFLAAFGFYTNLWTQHADWLLVTPLLFIAGTIAETGGVPLRTPSLRWRREAPRAVEASFIAAVAVAVSVVLALAYELVRTPGPPAVAGTVISRVTPSRTLRLPEGVTSAYMTALADGYARAELPTIWFVEQSRRAITLTRVAWDESLVPRPSRASIRWRPRAIGFDVVKWNGDGSALVILTEAPRGINVHVVALASTHRILQEGLARIDPVSRTIVRTFGVVRWSGRLPDLVVIDRSRQPGSPIVRVFSGESSFSKRVATIVVPAMSAMNPPAWAVDVGHVGGRAGVAAFLRDGRISGSGVPEAHVFTGRTLTDHILGWPLAVPRTLPSSYLLLVGPGPSGSVFYGLDRAHRALEVFG